MLPRRTSKKVLTVLAALALLALIAALVIAARRCFRRRRRTRAAPWLDVDGEDEDFEEEEEEEEEDPEDPTSAAPSSSSVPTRSPLRFDTSNYVNHFVNDDGEHAAIQRDFSGRYGIADGCDGPAVAIANAQGKYLSRASNSIRTDFTSNWGRVAWGPFDKTKSCWTTEKPARCSDPTETGTVPPDNYKMFKSQADGKYLRHAGYQLWTSEVDNGPGGDFCWNATA